MNLLITRLSISAGHVSVSADPVVEVPVLLVMFAVLLVLFVLRQRQLLQAERAGQDRARPLIPASLLTQNSWNLLMIYIASFSTWAGLDVSNSRGYHGDNAEDS